MIIFSSFKWSSWPFMDPFLDKMLSFLLLLGPNELDEKEEEQNEGEEDRDEETITEVFALLNVLTMEETREL